MKIWYNMWHDIVLYFLKFLLNVILKVTYMPEDHQNCILDDSSNLVEYLVIKTGIVQI